MIVDIAEYIIDEVLAYQDLSGDCTLPIDLDFEYKDGLYLAYKDPEKGILYKTSSDYEYAGIDDRKGNYVYLRFVDNEEIIFNPPVPRKTSCQEAVQAQANMRLISVIETIPIVDGKEKYEVEQWLRNVLLSIDFTGYTGEETNIDIELTRSLINNMQILGEEEVKKVMNLNYIITAIDFTLRFIYQNYPV
jgi:hypothetical protein